MNTNNTKNEAMTQENEGSNNGNIANTFMALHMSALSFLQERSLNLLNNTQTGEGQTTKRKPLLTLINMKNQTKKQILTSCLIALSSLFLASGAFAATITSKVTTGNWNVDASWVGDKKPVDGDDVVIAAGAIITVNSSLTLGGTTNLTVNTGGFLYLTSSLNIPGNVTNDGTISITSTSNSNDRTFTCGGNLTNGGTLSIPNVTGTGSKLRTISVTGSLTNNGTITINTIYHYLNSGDLINNSTGTINTNSGIINVTGNLTNNKVGSVLGTINANSGNINLSGNFTNDGTFNCGTSKVTVLVTGKSFLGTSQLTLYNLMLTRQISLTNSTDLVVTNAITNSSSTIGSQSTLVLNTNSKLTIGGSISSFVILDVTLNKPNTVIYNGSSQTVRDLAYSTLVLNGTNTTLPTFTTTPSVFEVAANKTYSITADLTLNSLTIGSGATFQIGNASAVLTLKGDLLNNGTFTTNTGNVIFNGTTAQKIYSTSSPNFSQTNINNLLVNNTVGLDINSPVNILYTLTLGNSAKVNANGNLTIKSTSATGTARVATLPAGASITGSVTVERLLPGNNRVGVRFLSSAVTNVSVFNSWQEGGTYTAGYGTKITGTNASASTFAAATALSSDLINPTTGLDYSPSLPYALMMVGNNSYRQITNTKNEYFEAGKGYSLLVRGDRGVDLFGAIPTICVATTLRAKGTLNQGEIPVTLTPGYNLVGNPYASPIDWNTQAWKDARLLEGNIDGAIYYLNASVAPGTGNRFACYNGTIVTGYLQGNPQIAPGQGFYVNNNGSNNKTLKFQESYKTTTATGYFKNNTIADLLRVEYLYNNEHQDDIAINFDENGSKNLNRNLDAVTIASPSFGLASLKGNSRLSIAVRPTIETVDTIALSVMSYLTGKFSLKFTEIESFAGMTQMVLVDKYLNKMINIDKTIVYNFDVTSDPNSIGNNRFVILFSKVGTAAFTTGLVNATENVSNVILYPNPAISSINLACSNADVRDFSYEIYNQMGQSVSTGAGNFANGNVEVVNIENLDKGIYFVKMFYNNSAEIIRFVK